ncbi:hypothetical protein [Streptomyces sp. NPDC055186]
MIMQGALLARQRIVLVTDAAEVSKPIISVLEKTKISTLRKYFTTVADE